MDDRAKEYIAFMAMLVGLAWAVAFAVVMTDDSPAPSDDYKLCLESGGSFIAHGPGEYECKK